MTVLLLILKISATVVLVASIAEALAREYPLRWLLGDLRSARSVCAFVGYLFKPPGWRPDGPGETIEELRRRAALQPASSPQSPAPDFIHVTSKELS